MKLIGRGLAKSPTFVHIRVAVVVDSEPHFPYEAIWEQQQTHTMDDIEEEEFVDEDIPETPRFLFAAGKIIRGAWFVVTSLPAVEPFAVERTLFQLRSIRSILECTPESLSLPPEKIQQLIANIEELTGPLESHASAAPVPVTGPSVIRDGQPHRPRYDIDVHELYDLRWMGASWKEIGELLGVHPNTARNHMQRANLPTHRLYSPLSDDDLDEKVASIVLQHPFSGAIIVTGCLLSMGLKVPHVRVQASLKRVDPVGVMFR